MIDLAIQLDIVQKSGSWFSMGDERIGQGKDSVKTYLMNNPDIAEKVEKAVRENMPTLMGGDPRSMDRVAKAPVVVLADDFNDED